MSLAPLAGFVLSRKINQGEGGVGENIFGSLNTGNYDVGSDDINQNLDTREMISRVKPDLLIRLKSVAAGVARKNKYA